MQVAEALIEQLKLAGVKVIFGIAGSATLDIMKALNQTSEVRFIPTVHEQAAGLMACGYYLTTGEPGVCLVTVGPGATNIVSPVAQAYLESWPIIIISGENSTRIFGKGRSNFHEFDQAKLFDPITKYSRRVERGERVLEELRHSFRSAVTGRPGPVYLGIPRDLQRMNIADGAEPVNCWLPATQPGAVPDLLEEIAQLLKKSENPVILAGGGVRAARAQTDVMELASILQIPVVITSSHKGLFPDGHPLVMGRLGSRGNVVAKKLVSEADLILALGTTFSELSTGGYANEVINEKTKIVQVDIDPCEIGKNYPVHTGIVADIGVFASQLLSMARARKLQVSKEQIERIDKLQELKDNEYRARLQEAIPSEPIKPSFLIKTLQAVLPEDCVITSDSGGDWLGYAYRANTPFLGIGDFGLLGSGFGMALGAKVADPRKAVVCVTGDGAFNMVLQDLGTAVAEKINLVTIVINNGVYGNLKAKQAMHFNNQFIGVDLLPLNYARLAESFGAVGLRVERPEELQHILQTSLAYEQPVVVDVVIDQQVQSLEPVRNRSAKDSLHL